MKIELTEKERTEINNKIIDLLVELGFWELTDDDSKEIPAITG